MNSNYLKLIKEKLRPYDNNSYYNPSWIIPTNETLYYVGYHKKMTVYHYSTPENCSKILDQGFQGHEILKNTENFTRCCDLANLEKINKGGFLFGFSNMLRPNGTRGANKLRNKKHIFDFNNYHCLDFVNRGAVNALQFEAECIEAYHSGDNQFQLIFDVSSVENIKLLEDAFNLQKYDIHPVDIMKYKHVISKSNSIFISEEEILNEVGKEFLKIKDWLNGYFVPIKYLPATHIKIHDEKIYKTSWAKV